MRLAEDLEQFFANSDWLAFVADHFPALFFSIGLETRRRVLKPEKLTSAVAMPTVCSLNIFLTQNLASSTDAISVQSNRTYLNCADSTAVSFGSINTGRMLHALLACINALSRFFTDKPST